MNDKVQLLLSILQQEFKIYNDLFFLMDEEYTFLVDGNVLELQKATQAKEAYLRAIVVLEENREQVCGELAKAHNLTERPVRLMQLAEKLDEASAKTLKTWKHTFDDLLKRLQDKNEVNQLMANNALVTVENTIGAVKESLQTTNMYQKKGQVKKGEQVEHLFSKKA
ncbi:MAG: flagellar protein FlgN [Bdellovibrionales bacterium]|nr:flagellar protein FlgN [Bdellovibrionales bacterium]